MIMWPQTPPLQKIGPLECLEFQGSGRGAVVLFHGYGADAYDLAPLHEELTQARSVRWLFPQGPRRVEIGPGFWGRAWFPIDLVAHERAIVKGEEISYADRRPAGVDEARDQVLSFLKASGLAVEQTVLGGFSQGAMLAVEVALTLPTLPKGLILLSGTLADSTNLKLKAPLKKGLRFFQSHGERDRVLPFSGGEALHQALKAAGWDGSWCPFAGGHEIPGNVLRELNSFLRELEL